ncbi:hypothetical protein HDU86_002384 [Geranomyces michiganensis]|nr:hypothetical protein HDU86_002384 [Geranomyces michiganensis]
MESIKYRSSSLPLPEKEPRPPSPLLHQPVPSGSHIDSYPQQAPPEFFDHSQQWNQPEYLPMPPVPLFHLYTPAAQYYPFQHQQPPIQPVIYVLPHPPNHQQLVPYPVPVQPKNRGRRTTAAAEYDNSTALWVGNLPDNVSDTDIRAFFSDCNILSIRNMQETHCAFLNFSSYEEVIDTAHRYRLAEFWGYAIETNPRVNHARKHPRRNQRGSFSSSTSSKSTSSAKTPSPPASPPPQARSLSSSSSSSPASSGSSPDTITDKPSNPTHHNHQPTKDRFFILKCIGQENLDIARKRNQWATQRANEAKLNNAYRECDNVFLIFGENKSGKFYGCARMAGPIEAAADDDADDDARTIHNQTAWKRPPPETAPSAAAAARLPQWGTDFPIHWQTKHELPFSQISNLRNPWNHGKPVKQARDGVEVFPETGRALLAAFVRNDDEKK